MPKGKDLTPKQQKFLDVYLKSGNASEAYRQAYDAKSMSAQAIHTEASKLLQHPAITRRLGVVKERAIEKAAVSVESLLSELEEARQLAKGKENSSVMVQATLGKAKVGGFIVDKKEIGGPGEFALLSDEELDARINHTLSVLGEDTRH